jgi:flagellar biosynthesis GTPase FlhF
VKKLFFLFLFLLIAVGFYAGHIIDDNANTLLKTIKLSEDEAKNTIFSDISSASAFYLPGIKELKSIAGNDRASQVQVVGKYVKDFTKTEDFKNRYNEFRESRKPSPPEKPKTMKELKKENKESLEKSLEEMKTTKASMPTDQQAMFDETIKMLEQQLKELDDPNNSMYSPEMDVYMQQSYDQQIEQHKKDIIDWETKYPENNPNALIKTWLESFLEQTKDVDFNAQTAIDNNRTLFVKQEYERKNNLWKLCYRGGKETTEAGRKFAQSWLNELK